VRITLAENFRAILYSPFYALRALGFAAEEGLTVEWLPPRTPGAVFDEVKQGAVDLAWGGPIRVMKDHDVNASTGATLLCFAEVVSRDPFALVAKPNWHAAGLSGLLRARFATVSEVPTPWLCLQADLHEAGLASRLSDQDVVNGLSMEQQLQALERGEVDVVQLFEPYISRAVAEGAGEIIYAAWDRGPTVYTTFICSRDGLARHREAFRRLTSALRRVQQWIATNGTEELARVVTPFFPDISSELLRSAIRRYCDAEIWAVRPEVSKIGFERLTGMLWLSGYLTAKQKYDSCVAQFDQ